MEDGVHVTPSIIAQHVSPPASPPRAAPAAFWHRRGVFLVRIHQRPCRGLLFAPVGAGGGRGGGVVMAFPVLATRHPGVFKLHHVSVRGVCYLPWMP